MVALTRCSCCFTHFNGVYTPQQGSVQFTSVMGGGSSELARIAEWAKGFDRLLDDPEGVVYFQDFLRKEYAEENIKFWLACRKYEGIADVKKRQEQAAIIISEYLVSGAPNSINIDAAVREEVVKSCHIAPPSLFKPMQKEIYNLMMYGKYWQFTRSDDFLNLLEQEKLGKTPKFKHHSTSSPKDGKRKNVIPENNHRNRKFFNFFGIRKRTSDDELEVIQHSDNNHHSYRHAATKQHVLLEMPNCTLRRAYYTSQESVKSCVERALINTGVDLGCYHICIKATGEIIDVNRPVSQFGNMTLSFLNTPTFQVSLCNNKKFKFCTTHGKTLKDICKSVLGENGIDLRSIILFEGDTRSFIRLDTQSVLVANKNLEVRDITQRAASVPRIGGRSKNSVRRSVTVACSASLESNLDLLSSVMESSDDEIMADFNSNSGAQLVRSQSELEFFELLNRVQCDRLDNQRCSHPTVLKNLSLGRRNDSAKKGLHYRRQSKPSQCHTPDLHPAPSTTRSPDPHNPAQDCSADEIDYC